MDRNQMPYNFDSADLFLDSDQTAPDSLFMSPDPNATLIDLRMLDSSWPTSPEEQYTQPTSYYPAYTSPEALRYTDSDVEAPTDDLFRTVSSSADAQPTAQPASSSDAQPTPQPTPSRQSRQGQRTVENTTQSLLALRVRSARRTNPPPSEPPPPRPSNRRVAHNLVERRYRDALNTELERLRLAIPHIRGLDSETPDGRPRPSKATVLASATEYIKKLEREIDALRDAVDGLDPRRRKGSMS